MACSGSNTVMSKTWPVLGILALSVASPAQTAKQIILGAYHQIDVLFARRDGAGLDKFMRAHVTPDFYSVSDGKKYNIDQNLAPMKPLLDHATKIDRPATHVKQVVVNGDHAVASLSGGFSATVVGKDGKSHVMAGSSDAIDHWVHVKGIWLIEKTEVSNQKFTIDGVSPAPRKAS